jgi:DNA mismatch repair ATPase MutS
MDASERGDSYITAHKEAQSLVSLNDQHQFYRNYSSGLGIAREVIFEHTPETVVDKRSLSLIQVDDLHRAIDRTTTATGSAELYRSLVCPPTDVEIIWAKQRSVEELGSDDHLRQRVTDYLESYRIGEESLFDFLNGRIDPRFPYSVLKKATQAGARMFEAAEDLPEPESEYLVELVSAVKGHQDSTSYRLMRGPIYSTFRGLKPKEDVHLYTPRQRFRPSRLTIENIAPSIPIIALWGAQSAGIVDGESVRELLNQNLAAVFALSTASAGPFMTLFMSATKPQLDYGRVIKPLKDIVVEDQSFTGVVDAVGKLDELMSFYKYPKTVPYETVVPKVTDGPKHTFEAKDLRNPVLVDIGEDDIVPITVSLDEHRLTFITGPNSGGKTTACLSVTQNQLLGQNGGSILASYGILNAADRIAYQAPLFDALQDAEGRFGTQLIETRDIFFSISPLSLVIIDELAEGTTVEEKKITSEDILHGFQTIGGTTILVTHNHDLVTAFQARDSGQFWQVELDGEEPTYKVVPGISTHSHADKIAKKVGFSREDIDRHLRDSGYLSE